MRTTVDIPDDLYRQAKAEAALRGKPLRELIEEGLRRVLTTPEPDSGRRRVTYPLVRSKRPGSMSLDDLRHAEEQSFIDEDKHHAGSG